MPATSVLAIAAGCLGIVVLGDLGNQVPLFFLSYAVAFVGYLFAIGTSDRWSFRSVLLFGLGFRLTLLVSEPSLSDDIYRYVWDGLVQKAGINPYLFAPSSDVLMGISDDVLARVNHPDLPTIYPPFAQLFFLVCTSLYPDPISIRIGILVWDSLTLMFLAGLARSYDLSPTVGLVFFWNPLVLVEGVGQGHIDAVAISLLVVALLYVRLHGYGRAAVALALSSLTKFLPILLLPAFWRWAGRAQADERSTLGAMVSTRALLVPLFFAAVFLGGYVPYMDAGWGVLGSLGVYAEFWAFNAPLFGLLSDLGMDGQSARIVLGTGLMVVVLAVTLTHMPPIQAAYYVVGTFIVMTPTMHPWYVLWIVPFLCFYGNRGWITMSGLVVLAYWVLSGYRESGVWVEETWVRWTIFLIPALVYSWPRMVEALNRKKGAPNSTPSDQKPD